MSNTAHLNYAPPLPVHQRRLWRRVLVAFSIIVLVGSSWVWGPPAWQRAQIMYWQHGCLNYADSPDHAVYDFDDAENKLFAQANADWGHLQALTRGNRLLANQDCCVFLHEMRRPDGTARLVCIYPELANAHGIGLRGEIYEPGSFGRIPRFIGSDAFIDLDELRGHRRIQLFAAQLDPANSSHVTADYEFDGRRVIIDGWLDDNDHLLLARRR